MVRSILSVIAGYVVMAILVALTFAPVLLAPGLVFENGSASASLAFSIYNLVASAVAAMAGGFVAALVAGQGSRALQVFAGIVLVFGLASAVAGLRAERPIVTAEEISNMTTMERASKGKEPTWYAFLLPFVGAGGVLAGGALHNWMRKQTSVS